MAIAQHAVLSYFIVLPVFFSHALYLIIILFYFILLLLLFCKVGETNRPLVPPSLDKSRGR